MKNYLTLNRIKLVREMDVEYDAPHTITCPEDAVEVANAIFDMENLAEETLIVLLLDMKNHVIGAHELSHGTVDRSIANPREMFKAAILHNASLAILCHNHPSGDPALSIDDIESTVVFMKLGKMMGIEVLDHIVIGDHCHISIKEKLAK